MFAGMNCSFEYIQLNIIVIRLLLFSQSTLHAALPEKKNPTSKWWHEQLTFHWAIKVYKNTLSTTCSTFRKKNPHMMMTWATTLIKCRRTLQQCFPYLQWLHEQPHSSIQLAQFTTIIVLSEDIISTSKMITSAHTFHWVFKVHQKYSQVLLSLRMCGWMERMQGGEQVGVGGGYLAVRHGLSASQVVFGPVVSQIGMAPDLYWRVREPACLHVPRVLFNEAGREVDF